jgi:hypothetical protein
VASRSGRAPVAAANAAAQTTQAKSNAQEKV